MTQDRSGLTSSGSDPLNSIPINEVNELAKERTRLAAERTLLSWVQNSLLLIGSGIAIDRIARNVSRAFPADQAYASQTLASGISLGALAVGIGLLVLAALEYPVKLRAMETAAAPLDLLQVNLAVAILAVLAFGLLALLLITLAPAS